MAMTFGIHVGHLGGPMPELRRLWRVADEAGFNWFSVFDHIAFRRGPYDWGAVEAFATRVLPGFGVARPSGDTARRGQP